jgi:hypothetical protein
VSLLRLIFTVASEDNCTCVTLSGSLCDPRFYFRLLILLVFVFFGMKILQRHLNGFDNWFQEGIKGRIFDISFWFGVCLLLTTILIANCVHASPVGQKQPLSIALRGRYLIAACVLTVLEIALYLSAVLRDNGTFFHHLQAPGERLGVLMIQVVEGLLNVFVLLIASFWAVVGYWLYDEYNALQADVRIRTYPKFLRRLRTACAAPSLVLTVLGTYSITIDWKTGIADSFLAVSTALLMWTVYLFLLYKMYANNLQELHAD